MLWISIPHTWCCSDTDTLSLLCKLLLISYAKHHRSMDWKKYFKSSTKSMLQATRGPATDTLTLDGSSSTRSVTLSGASHLLFCIAQNQLRSCSCGCIGPHIPVILPNIKDERIWKTSLQHRSQGWKEPSIRAVRWDSQPWRTAEGFLSKSVCSCLKIWSVLYFMGN